MDDPNAIYYDIPENCTNRSLGPRKMYIWHPFLNCRNICVAKFYFMTLPLLMDCLDHSQFLKPDLHLIHTFSKLELFSTLP